MNLIDIRAGINNQVIWSPATFMLTMDNKIVLFCCMNTTYYTVYISIFPIAVEMKSYEIHQNLVM